MTRVIRDEEPTEFYESMAASPTAARQDYIVHNISLAERIVGTALAIIEVLLGLRLVFRLFGASFYNGFVQFIMNLTVPLVAPFRTMFSVSTIDYQLGAFELYTLVAMIAYALLAFLVILVIRALSNAEY